MLLEFVSKLNIWYNSTCIKYMVKFYDKFKYMVKFSAQMLESLYCVQC